jgi:capsular polysaccharide biosynthesis protein
MSQQGLDLRKSIQSVRRHRVLVGIVVALGLLIGGGYATINPPLVTSTALVVLPSSAPSMATQVVIAGSDPVLSIAQPKVSPPMSLDKLRGKIQVRSLTSYLIAITAKGSSAADTEATANAVAQAYIAYVGTKNTPVGHVVARIFQPATAATGSSPTKALVVTGLIGALAGAVIGIIVSLAISRKDRRLRVRDEIANSVGLPVLASVPVAHPSDAAGWTKLLEDYKPTAVHAWQLRTALQQLGMAEPSLLGRAALNGDGSSLYDGGGSFSVVVLSLSSDPGAIALGPQLAVFAASQGIPTSLVIGPQQDASVTATLRTACAVPSGSPKWPGLLRVTASDGGGVNVQPDTALVVVVAVVDGKEPKMPDTLRTSATALGVSAGAATAEQLARAAVAAAADGREITGILVADPEPTDQTTGRIPHLVRPARRRVPNRLRGIVTEIRR